MYFPVLRVAGAVFALALGSASAAAAETIRVGVTAGPHAEILDIVRSGGSRPRARYQGGRVHRLRRAQPGTGAEGTRGEFLPARALPQEPALQDQLEDHEGRHDDRVAAGSLIPRSTRSSPTSRKAPSVAIANDPSNGARGLLILAEQGLIKLKDGKTVTATVADIVDNPKKLRFVELDAAQLPRSLQDVDLVSINNNYAVQAGLNPAKDAIARESLEGPWVNILAVREEDKDKPWVKKLIEAYHSPAVKAFLEKRFAGTYIATW